jgi:putative lipoic acid-binding regulatory protein
MINEDSIQDQGFRDEEIVFPVSYVLKVIVTRNITPERHTELIEEILLRKKIPYRFEDTKQSKEGTYLSFSIFITLINKLQMKELYNDLRSLPWIKLAL